MSDHEDQNHEGPIKTPKQFLMAVLYSFILPIFIIIGLVYFVTSANKPLEGSSDLPKSVQERIQKVGVVDIRDANRTLKSGEEVFKGQCSTCHAIGALGSPKFGDATAWGPRIKKGYDALLTSALKGKGNMSAQGGGEFDDVEIGRAVVYMANAGGAKFADPKAPASAQPDASNKMAK
jgi:cytochrome c5